jgi:hypothetical protein
MLGLNPKYAGVKIMHHNINGEVVDMHGVGEDFSIAPGPEYPRGLKKIHRGATQADYAFVKGLGDSDVVVEIKEPQLTTTDKAKIEAVKTDGK